MAYQLVQICKFLMNSHKCLYLISAFISSRIKLQLCARVADFHICFKSLPLFPEVLNHVISHPLEI